MKVETKAHIHTKPAFSSLNFNNVLQHLKKIQRILFQLT